MNNKTKHEPLISSRELAEILKTDLPGIRRLFNSGRIPGYELGPRKLLFRESEVLKKLQTN